MNGYRSIGVAQTCPVRGDIDANLEQHLRLVRLAADCGARVLVFPELSLTGYELDLAARLALSEDDARLAAVSDAARACALTVILGAPIRIGLRLHIGAFVVDSSGARSVYTKQRLGAFDDNARCDGSLPPAEPTIFQPGTLDPLVQLDDSSAAIAICADTGLAAHAERAAARGVRAYLASMFVIRSEFAEDSARLRGYARQHALCVALSNFGCATGGLAAAGRSSIWSETGELVLELAPSGVGLGVATETSDGWHSHVAMLAAASARE